MKQSEQSDQAEKKTLADQRAALDAPQETLKADETLEDKASKDTGSKGKENPEGDIEAGPENNPEENGEDKVTPKTDAKADSKTDPETDLGADFETAYAEKVQHDLRLRREETEQALRQEWGRDFTRNTAMAVHTINRFLNLAEQKELRESGVEASASFRRLCARIGQFFGEDPAASSTSGLSLTQGGHEKNPYAPDSLNLTLQTRLEKENPAYANSLKRAAGKHASDVY